MWIRSLQQDLVHQAEQLHFSNTWWTPLISQLCCCVSGSSWSALCFRLIRRAKEVPTQHQRPERKQGVSPWSQINDAPPSRSSCLLNGKHSPLLIKSNHNRKSQRGGELWRKKTGDRKERGTTSSSSRNMLTGWLDRTIAHIQPGPSRIPSSPHCPVMCREESPHFDKTLTSLTDIRKQDVLQISQLFGIQHFLQSQQVQKSNKTKTPTLSFSNTGQLLINTLQMIFHICAGSATSGSGPVSKSNTLGVSFTVTGRAVPNYERMPILSRIKAAVPTWPTSTVSVGLVSALTLTCSAALHQSHLGGCSVPHRDGELQMSASTRG